MLVSALEALQVLLSPQHLLWTATGVALGVMLGIIPGLSGLTGMAVLLPLVVGLEPASAIALLIGLMAATTIGDTFPSILMGVPGTAASQATVVDGYPMARQGLGRFALGASFMANLLGGVLGAMTLFLLIPLARPLILGFGSPQLLALTLLGLSLIAVLTRGAVGPSLVAALGGMFLASIGSATMTGEYRFVGNVFYFYDGLDLLILAIGLFAVPSVLSLLTQGQAVTPELQSSRGGVLRGALTALRHRGVLIGNSLLGTFLGIVPGIGGSVIDWIAYGGTKRLARKNRENFGKGDVRGVIAPEAANNAKDGGVLVPTLMFGIPGSATAAILLGGLATIGVTTGPSMLRPENLYLILVIAWTLALANVLGALACMGMVGPLSRLSLLQPRTYAPFLLVIMLVAGYQSGRRWGDLVAVVVIGLLAWLMQAMKWPRPPLLIGFVLGPAAENYLWLSVSRYGWDWLLWPSVLVILGIAAITIASSFTGAGPGAVLDRATAQADGGSDDRRTNA
ncbi:MULTISPECIES: tripartite tricarboxylate transporter permease [Pseudonocardia]|uniref:Tripartite tricarboxylate transporter TctA family protein n=2 Tax=Pseudonocardia TaxID=1847 RepID=A0A1Y2MLH1_PSEAH|nr:MULTISPECIES: tripartite tricarboxylate transporter permease [Pseudonocardia]OSY36136.1 Tripartite tricarboxylate transporter TctA family protein [Pseudonocardia autotrophica]TDN77618.1 TctA family transporter [Pseudonocardia autotrophica]BBG01648.1 hypothetical protein Pdca_28570 [Pseudonocardia autotrophica]GEC25393.1 hypothetical protein PSA01_24220 [Pseudonocardia saturnea]